MPALSYTISPYVPFTKILSASANQDKTDIKNRINWAGGTDAATGLGDSNIQSAIVSGGGLTRASKLKQGNANYVVINDSNGAMTEEAQLGITRGGTGLNIVPGNQNPGDVVQVNAAGTAIVIGVPIGIPASLRPYAYTNFT